MAHATPLQIPFALFLQPKTPNPMAIASLGNADHCTRVEKGVHGCEPHISTKLQERRNTMLKQDNRVLSRLGARELSEEDVAKVNGSRSLPTNTVCTFP